MSKGVKECLALGAGGASSTPFFTTKPPGPLEHQDPAALSNGHNKTYDPVDRQQVLWHGASKFARW